MEIPTDWTFERNDVAAGFDRHVREQLPWYDLCTGLIVHMVRHYLPDDGLAYDVGASTGNIGDALGETLLARHATLVEIERSPAMAERWRTAHQTSNAIVKGTWEEERAQMAELDRRQALAERRVLQQRDALRIADWQPFDVAILFLILQFMPLGERAGLLARLCAAMKPGGAIVLVDKFNAPDGYLGSAVRRLTLAGKLATGTAPAEIVAKELSLAGVQRPLVEPLIRRALPINVEMVEIFRWGEFRGFVIERGEL